MERVLVTGAAGFLGAAALPVLQRAGYALRATWHWHAPRDPAPGVEWHQDDLVSARERGADLLRDVNVVIHLAARVHVTGLSRCLWAPFHRANVLATTQLAEQSVRAGVRRFIFLSSVGVHGRENRVLDGLPQPLRADDPMRPRGAYARSKLAAETALARICAGGGMELVRLRAPLVFGPGNGGNFLRLLWLLDHGLPLPVGPRPAPRSLVYSENLAQLLLACTDAAGVANRAFLLADFDLPVQVLADRVTGLLGRRLRTLRLPDVLLRHGPLQGLTQPLLIDGLPVRAATGWQPAIGQDAALARTVAWYRAGR